MFNHLLLVVFWNVNILLSVFKIDSFYIPHFVQPLTWIVISVPGKFIIKSTRTITWSFRINNSSLRQALLLSGPTWTSHQPQQKWCNATEMYWKMTCPASCSKMHLFWETFVSSCPYWTKLNKELDKNSKPTLKRRRDTNRSGECADRK